MRRNTDAMRRSAERRKREDDAPRLKELAPGVSSLRLELEERRGGETVAGSNHVRHIVVDTAPALFVLQCGERGCNEGGHNVTEEILAALERGEERFEGDHACEGQLGEARCGSVLHYVATATYDR